MVYNARTVSIKHNINVSVGYTSVRVSVFDGIEYLQDTAPVVSGEGPAVTVQFSLTAQQSKSLELSLRDFGDDGRITIDVHDDNTVWFGPLVYTTEKYDPEGNELLKSLGVATAAAVAVMPKRFRKFSLLKPGDYPVDFKTVYSQALGREIVRWKAGPTVEGAILALDREVLETAQDVSHLWIL
jgi:hypothetical protein